MRNNIINFNNNLNNFKKNIISKRNILMLSNQLIQDLKNNAKLMKPTYPNYKKSLLIKKKEKKALK